MKCLLDTNAIIALMSGDQSLHAQLSQNRVSDYGISAIVAHELYYGAYKGSRTPQNLAALDKLRFEVVEFDSQDAQVAGELRAELEQVGGQIGILDTLIAGQAKSRGLALLTRNVSEFKRVSGLTIEHW